MADIVLDVQSPPATPSAGQGVLYIDTLSKKLKVRPDTGLESICGDIYNFSTANVAAAFAADTYLAGSAVAVPSSLLRAGSMYYFCFDMVKTAAGTAAAAINVRFGTNGTTADTAQLTFTFGAGTAAVDTGIFELWCHVRTSGAAGVMVGMARCTHHLAATGLISTGASGTGIILVTSAAFDMTVANSILGVSFNGGAAFSGTNTVQQSRLSNV